MNNELDAKRWIRTNIHSSIVVFLTMCFYRLWLYGIFLKLQMNGAPGLLHDLWTKITQHNIPEKFPKVNRKQNFIKALFAPRVQNFTEYFIWYIFVHVLNRHGTLTLPCSYLLKTICFDLDICDGNILSNDLLKSCRKFF